ncbi:hypothetical protein B0T22DRAFT_495308 [Podospora appendiculata]|uniref:DUF7492 domain-containing protein n=1 Tax=Podospora appendiculata TaxID=314037 RepID=A0AAE1C6U1_9PEZI|nr:hypothetical protein B0T22DRAFT_495308 [Podospora appendiculata]
MHFAISGGLLPVALLSLLELATAHSWSRQTRRLAPNGTMIGAPGYERHHNDQDLGVAEDHISWVMPPNDRPDGKIIHLDDKIVRPNQRPLGDSSYTDQYPMLKVAPGDFVAIQYTENGHVSLPDKTGQPVKPVNRGTVYLYGTTENDLTNANLCYEAIPKIGDTEGITPYRQSTFKNDQSNLMCQSDVQIPTDVPVGKPYTIIWLWDWPTMSEEGVAVPPATWYANNSDTGKPYVKIPELYASVVDFDIVDPCDPSLGDVKGPTCKNKKRQECRLAGFNVTDATAAPSDIPLGGLIGMKQITFPLPASILAGNANAGPDKPVAGPSPTGAAPPDATPTGKILTVTVTVPRAPSSSRGPATPRPAPRQRPPPRQKQLHFGSRSQHPHVPTGRPAVSPFLDSKKVRVRRGNGEWHFGPAQ